MQCAWDQSGESYCVCQVNIQCKVVEIKMQHLIFFSSEFSAILLYTCIKKWEMILHSGEIYMCYVTFYFEKGILLPSKFPNAPLSPYSLPPTLPLFPFPLCLVWGMIWVTLNTSGLTLGYNKDFCAILLHRRRTLI